MSASSIPCFFGDQVTRTSTVHNLIAPQGSLTGPGISGTLHGCIFVSQ